MNVRVRRNDTTVFESTYEEIPNHETSRKITGIDSIKEKREYNGYYTNRPNVRFVNPNWDNEPATYTIRYELPSEEWKKIQIDTDSSYIGVQIFIGGGGNVPKSTSVKINDFEDESDFCPFIKGSDDMEPIKPLKEAFPEVDCSAS